MHVEAAGTVSRESPRCQAHPGRSLEGRRLELESRFRSALAELLMTRATSVAAKLLGCRLHRHLIWRRPRQHLIERVEPGQTLLDDHDRLAVLLSRPEHLERSQVLL